ncbi:hypothetical protein JKF63_05587 [Porcisia hertigi]|uniref:Uncharacterized protein n=1 Tax=Porcisia hertigi TaxID=2761500 RepID=A0A836ILH6_9TRYP|nr:hypothetical protein JKF63_05587 [Porcisia hertigi]
MSGAVTSFFKRGWQSVKEEVQSTFENIRDTKFNIAFLFAVLCIFFVIVGNVIILIAYNFWIAQFPSDSTGLNTKQIAIQVVTMLFLVFPFALLCVAFTIVYSPRPLWRVLTDRNRVRGPWYRFFLIFASGATNSISSIIALYAMTHTPEFIQAVLLCCIPFSAQAWTVIFIPIERERDYLSLTFIVSILLFVAGILLSSFSAFLHPNTNGEKALWAWALLYLVSTIIFGLWCVAQRLYLDSVVLTAPLDARGAAIAHNSEVDTSATPLEHNDSVTGATFSGEDPSIRHTNDGGDKLLLSSSEELLARRQWGKQNVDDNAAKMVLLVVGLFFQLLISFAAFPVDATPFLGSSTSAPHAWEGFRNSINFIFSSWLHVRYGLLVTLGFAMSFVGCTYLNEQSPTLASVVLQLAGPITSLVIIIIPQWNVFQDSISVGEKVGGVILLLLATLLYNLWDQQSLRVLRAKAKKATYQSEPTVPAL